jgi:hypothetical protein
MLLVFSVVSPPAYPRSGSPPSSGIPGNRRVRQSPASPGGFETELA